MILGVGRKGVALATALLLTMLLLVLGISYLNLIQSDLGYLTQQERGMRSYYLARAGLDYYIQKNYQFGFGGIKANPQLGPQSSPPYGPVVVGPNEYFFLTVRTNVAVRDPKTGNNVAYDMVVSKGVITNSLGQAVTTRTLMAPKVGPPLTFKNMDTGPYDDTSATDHQGLDRGRIYEIYDDSL